MAKQFLSSEQARTLVNAIADRLDEVASAAGSAKPANNLIPITYSDLVSLRNSSKLYPGATYRITNYKCSSSDTNAAVVNVKFDILVKAIDTNKLSEHCGVMRNASDAHFPAATNFDAWEVWYCLDNDTTRFGWASTNGKGVIYRLIDEFGNDCPYDFKSIVFKRTTEWFSNHKDWCTNVLGTVPSGGRLYFTFSLADANLNGNTDLSINHYNGQKYLKFYQNKIAPYYSDGVQKLNGNVFILKTLNDTGCYNNTFGNGCLTNTFGNGCSNNTFGNGCQSNIFGNGCHSNTFENDYYNNSFGNNCHSNSFGNLCYSNSFGNTCYSNSFGNDCNSNTFGNSCYSNSFGSNCDSNTFGDGCHSNTFGNNCDSTTFGSTCYNNSFGNNCDSNTFEANCTTNFFRNGCNSNLFKAQCSFNTFGNNSSSNKFWDNCTSNTFGNSFISNTFGDKCSSNTFGNGCRSNTLGGSCSYNFFKNYCVDNHFGGSCNYNTFGNDCHGNLFGSDCGYNTFGNSCYNIFFGSSSSSLRSYYRYNCFEDGVQYIIFYTSQTTSSTSFLQNITIHRGVKGSSNSPLKISVTEVNKNYNREYGRNASGTLINWVANA